jgi:AraC-like DNA-binding protein
MRHRYEPRSGVSISTLAYDYPAKWQVSKHEHACDQLVYAKSGVMEVSVAQTRWLIPPQFAIWIPANVRHSIRMPNAVAMRTLYLRSRLARSRDCTVLSVSPLLRELIVEAVRVGELKSRRRETAALSDVLVAQINKASPVPTMLAMPSDPRARRVAQSVISSPRQAHKLEPQCRLAGVSVRTMQRLFMHEVGMDFQTWRRQARLVSAIESLLCGASVKSVALALGYRQPSAFVAMFRKVMGATPKSWSAALTPPGASAVKYGARASTAAS